MKLITQLFAFVVTDHEGVEGVLFRHQSETGTQPMIASQLDHLEKYRADAADMAGQMQLPLKVARFMRTEWE